jgi:hypothetical protein
MSGVTLTIPGTPWHLRSRLFAFWGLPLVERNAQSEVAAWPLYVRRFGSTWWHCSDQSGCSALAAMPIGAPYADCMNGIFWMLSSTGTQEKLWGCCWISRSIRQRQIVWVARAPEVEGGWHGWDVAQLAEKKRTTGRQHGWTSFSDRSGQRIYCHCRLFLSGMSTVTRLLYWHSMGCRWWSRLLTCSDGFLRGPRGAACRGYEDVLRICPKGREHYV